jgi:signal transduction histidine kinase
MAIAAVVAVVALVLRLRRARGASRRQLRWVVAGALLLAAGLAMFAAELTPWGLYLGFAAVPVCAGIAILRYRLYDIDIIINRAIVLAVLAAFVASGYVSLVVVVGAALGTHLPSRFWPSLAVLVVVALAFQPLRQRVLRFADRLVYGRRAIPYEALSDFTRLLSRSRAGDQLLPVMAESLARRTGAAYARVSAELPALSASWPHPTELGLDVDVEVRDEAGVLGRIALVLPAGRGLLPAERRLLDDFAAQAALALRTLRLEAQLRDQAEQVERQAAALESSRSRLLAAQDDERRRTAAIIEREIVRHLRPISDAVVRLDPSNPDAARSTLSRLEQATEEALDALREVTHGVYPALLTHRGLIAALSGHATRTGRSGALTIGTGLADLRLSEYLESAAYFCGAALLAEAEALTVATEHGVLVLQATGEPDPDDGVVDRVEAAGGRLTRSENADGRSTVRVELPVQLSAASAQAASSRSVPSEDLAT